MLGLRRTKIKKNKEAKKMPEEVNDDQEFSVLSILWDKKQEIGVSKDGGFKYRPRK